MVWLYQNGRGFDERTHAHTSIYDLVDRAYADDERSVPLQLALHHHYPGLGVVVTEPAEGVDRERHLSWLRSEAVPGLLSAGPVDSWSAWVKHPPAEPQQQSNAPMKLGTDGGHPDRLVQLCFIEGDPVGTWEAFGAYAKAVDAGGVARVTFAAPFYGTDVGTDDHADQLW